MRPWLAAIALAGCAQPVPEAEDREPVEVDVHVDSVIATIGDTLTYTVAVDHDATYTVELPDLDGSLGGLAIVNQGSEYAESLGRVETARWAKLRTDTVGSYILPPPRVRSQKPGEEAWIDHETSRIFVEVVSVLPDEGAEDIRDLKPLQRPPAVPYDALLGALAVVVALLLAALAYFAVGWWRRRPPPPPLPPHELALRRLQDLRAQPLTDLERIRAWYFDMSAVLRAYIEARFGINATDMTSEELADHLTDVPDAEEERLLGFLDATDAVKYAARPPGEGDIDRVYDTAVAFVRGTEPPPVEAP